MAVHKRTPLCAGRTAAYNKIASRRKREAQRSDELFPAVSSKGSAISTHNSFYWWLDSVGNECWSLCGCTCIIRSLSFVSLQFLLNALLSSNNHTHTLISNMYCCCHSIKLVPGPFLILKSDDLRNKSRNVFRIRATFASCVYRLQLTCFLLLVAAAD